MATVAAPAAPVLIPNAALDARAVTLPAPAQETVYVLRSDHPQVRLTWGSRFPSKVDKLKLRKRIDVFPVKLTLKADYDTNTREFDYGCTARDALFGGSITLNLPDQQVEYRKKVGMPNGSHLVFSGSCALRDRQLKPNFGVQLEFGGHTHGPEGHANAVWAGNSFDVRHRVNIARGLGVEVCGSVGLPTPAARYSHDAGTLSLGEGAFQLHVAEVNAVLKI